MSHRPHCRPPFLAPPPHRRGARRGFLLLALPALLLAACGDKGGFVPTPLDGPPQPDPRTKWVYKASCGVYTGSPALSPDEQTVYFGTSFTCAGAPDQALYALAADSGTLLWRYALGADIVFSSPVVAPDGSIYFVASPYRLLKLAAGGTLSWEVSLNPSGRSAAPIGHPEPALGADGTVYVAGDRFYAIQPNGSPLWASGYQPYQSQTMHSSPVIASDGTVYFGFRDFHLTAFNGATGAAYWTHSTIPYGYDFAAPVLAADGETIYLPSDERGLYAVRSDGALVWNIPADGVYFLRSSPAIDASGGLYYGTSGDVEKAGIFARHADGSLSWFTIPPDIADDPAPAYHFDFYSSPALGADGLVYVGNEFGAIYGFDAGTGAVVWEYAEFKGPTGITWSSPAISAAGVLYIGTLDGDLLAIQTESGGLSTTAGSPKYRHDNQNTGRWP